MNLKASIKLLKQIRSWIVLILINDAFFIFLAWLAYPKTFIILVGIMITFSIATIFFGMFLELKKEYTRDKGFNNFIREPSKDNEWQLVEVFGELHEKKINCMANKLRLLKEQLISAKLQALEYEEFIESWVHEIKTPISLVTLILANRKEEMSEHVYQRLEHARINISDEVEQILYYARLHAAHVDYRFERVSLGLCFEDVLLELQSLLDEKQVSVISEFGELRVVSDIKALQFIITQVIVNAVKYSKEEIKSYIWLKAGIDRDANKYYLKISDNGIGILTSDLPFIFDKGFTGKTQNGRNATGIGLYLVKKLCDELHIEIEVEAEYGKGFEIMFLFPIVDEG